MSTPTRMLAGASLVLLALAGCQPTPTSPPPAPPTTTPGAPEGEKKAAGPVDPMKPAEAAADAGKLTEEELAQVKKLPADEQAAALAQMSCPVSGGHLGSMGMPIKQKVGDRTFYLCCDGCEKEVKEHPDAVVAKLTPPAAK